MKWVVAHMGRRDSFQIALALQEVGMLERLVVDIYFPFDKPWIKPFLTLFFYKLPFKVRARYKANLPSAMVISLWSIALRNALSEQWRLSNGDDCLGRYAGHVALQKSAALITYAPFAPAAFKACVNTSAPLVVFHYSAHPQSVRDILLRECEIIPNGKTAIADEPEMVMSQKELDLFDEASQLADMIIVPSSFVADTLKSQGCAADKVALIPYGVDVNFFTPEYAHINQRLKVLFVGRISFRKGVWHLLKAWQMSNLPNAELVLVGNIDPSSASWLGEFDGYYQHIPHVTHDELLALYKSAHILCMPSLAEGQSLTILESMACATPVIASTNSGGMDIIRHGENGLVFESGNVENLASCLQFSYYNRCDLLAMRRFARLSAENNSWSCFRHGLINHLRLLE